MALATLGTAATTTLTAIGNRTGSFTEADMVSIAGMVKDKYGNIVNSAISRGGLMIPGRGFVQIFPGDYIAVDPVTGWPILISAEAAAGASYVHT